MSNIVNDTFSMSKPFNRMVMNSMFDGGKNDESFVSNMKQTSLHLSEMNR